MENNFTSVPPRHWKFRANCVTFVIAFAAFLLILKAGLSVLLSTRSFKRKQKGKAFCFPVSRQTENICFVQRHLTEPSLSGTKMRICACSTWARVRKFQQKKRTALIRTVIIPGRPTVNGWYSAVVVWMAYTHVLSLLMSVKEAFSQSRSSCLRNQRNIIHFSPNRIISRNLSRGKWKRIHTN